RPERWNSAPSGPKLTFLAYPLFLPSARWPGPRRGLSRMSGSHDAPGRRALVLGLAAVVALASGATIARAAPRIVLAGSQVDDASGNGDGSLEPGETVTLRVSLYNDGDQTASAISGVLSYTGVSPDVSVLQSAATWPDLGSRGS